jgi:hypothetical protein
MNVGSVRTRSPHFALLTLSWLLESDLAISQNLRQKLCVAPGDLYVALKLLEFDERLELTEAIIKAGTSGLIVGPLRSSELCKFIEETVPGWTSHSSKSFA